MFDPKHIISGLKRNKEVIHSLLKDISREEFLFRENIDKWSLLEVLCHLVDEEKEDFRTRVKSVLADPEAPLPPIDPVGWVASRKYQEQDYDNKLREWVNERESSILWLESLGTVPWQNAFSHPRFGPLSAQLFICNWLSHDYHHIRQIISIRRAFIIYTTGENLLYAGKW